MSLKKELSINRQETLNSILTPEVQLEAKYIITSYILPTFASIHEKYPLRKRLPIYADFQNPGFFQLTTFNAAAIEGGSKCGFYKYIKHDIPYENVWYAVMEMANNYGFSADEHDNSPTKMILTMTLSNNM